LLILCSEVGQVGRKYLPSEKLINETKYSSAANFSSLSPTVLTSVAVMQNLLCGPDATSILDQVAAGGGESTRWEDRQFLFMQKQVKCDHPKYFGCLFCSHIQNYAVRFYHFSGLSKITS
jgi:hypothetical protein